MSIILKQVRNKTELRRFIKFPFRHHIGHKNWVPPLLSEEYAFYNPAQNKCLKKSDTILILAYECNELVGRIMGIINHQYNKMNNSKDARFFAVECIDNQEVFHELICFIEEWAREKGMSRLVGPYGFSDKDPQGFLIEGYKNTPSITTNFNYPYMVDLIENEGYKKEADCYSYKLTLQDSIPEIYSRILERVLRNNRLKVLEFANRQDIKPYIFPVFQLVNEAYSPLYGFVPLDEEEMIDLAKKYIMFIDPEFIKLIVDEKNDLAAFIIAIPDISEGLIRSGGKLFPFGFLRILKAAKNSKQLNLLLGAVKENYRNIGLDALLGTKIMETAKKRNMTSIDSHLILESNIRMIAELKKLNGEAYKKYRIFQKQLS